MLGLASFAPLLSKEHGDISRILYNVLCYKAANLNTYPNHGMIEEFHWNSHPEAGKTDYNQPKYYITINHEVKSFYGICNMTSTSPQGCNLALESSDVLR